MNRELSEIPGVSYQFSQYIEDNVNEAVSGVKAELSIKIYGNDVDQLQALADQTVDILEKIPGAADVGAEHLTGQLCGLAKSERFERLARQETICRESQEDLPGDRIRVQVSGTNRRDDPDRRRRKTPREVAQRFPR